MGERIRKRTLVKNIVTGEEFIFNSRWDACKFVEIKRKYINAYIDKGLTFNKKFKFIDLS